MNQLACALVAATLVGCSTTVPEEEIAAATRACEPHGGIGYITTSLTEHYFITSCVDGVHINGRVDAVLPEGRRE